MNILSVLDGHIEHRVMLSRSARSNMHAMSKISCTSSCRGAFAVQNLILFFNLLLMSDSAVLCLQLQYIATDARTSNERSAAPLSIRVNFNRTCCLNASSTGAQPEACPVEAQRAQRSEGPNAAGRARCAGCAGCAGGGVGTRKITSLPQLVVPFLLPHRLERPAHTQTS